MTAHRPPARRCAALVITAVLCAGVTASCGNEAPADAAPELAAQLTRVDRAISTGDDERARQRVEGLVSATKAARDTGELDDEQADRILAAADALLAQLPAAKPAPEPTPTPSPTASPSPEEDDDEHEEKPPKPEPKPKPPKDEHHKGKGHDD